MKFEDFAQFARQQYICTLCGGDAWGKGCYTDDGPVCVDCYIPPGDRGGSAGKEEGGGALV